MPIQTIELTDKKFKRNILFSAIMFLFGVLLFFIFSEILFLRIFAAFVVFVAIVWYTITKIQIWWYNR